MGSLKHDTPSEMHMTETSDPNQSRSILFVCVGNTCRSPMAAALARKRWPQCHAECAGIAVLREGGPAAQEAVEVMARHGIDISSHQAQSVSSMDISDFEIIVALSKEVRRELIAKHSVAEDKIRNMFVDDPFDDDLSKYLKCANEIARGLGRLSF